MATEYPPLGFHFLVSFELFEDRDIDTRFQSVSGLTVEVETEDFKEGGENRFVHKLPVRTKFTNITLQRGMLVGSELVTWCQEAIHNFSFAPTNLFISLLNEIHEPVASWYVVGAYPVSWAVADFKASESAVVIETIKLHYKYFKSYRT